ncbi:hypothetical protein KC315_g19552 [Hortaea werneckii]|nr:hypothetical protein KC315_g19552 [Hortaea werneckii]
MSKRVMPDAGPPSKRQREEEGGGGHHHGGGGGRGHGGGKKGKRHHQHDYDAQPAQNYGGYSGVTGGAPMPMEAYGYARPEPVAVATPPAVPTFGFSLPGQGGPPYQ